MNENNNVSFTCLYSAACSSWRSVNVMPSLSVSALPTAEAGNLGRCVFSLTSLIQKLLNSQPFANIILLNSIPVTQ